MILKEKRSSKNLNSRIITQKDESDFGMVCVVGVAACFPALKCTGKKEPRNGIRMETHTINQPQPTNNQKHKHKHKQHQHITYHLHK